jgi:hypothetical protein
LNGFTIPWFNRTWNVELWEGKRIKQFPPRYSGRVEEKDNNNVNRRFTGRELKPAAAAADDETIRKATWLTLETWWKN